MTNFPEILNDPEAMRMLQESIADIRAGRLHEHNAMEKAMG